MGERQRSENIKRFSADFEPPGRRDFACFAGLADFAQAAGGLLAGGRRASRATRAVGLFLPPTSARRMRAPRQTRTAPPAG